MCCRCSCGFAVAKMACYTIKVGAGRYGVNLVTACTCSVGCLINMAAGTRQGSCSPDNGLVGYTGTGAIGVILAAAMAVEICATAEYLGAALAGEVVDACPGIGCARLQTI